MAYKIAVVGSKDVVIPFKMIGFDIFPTHTAEEARRTIDRLASEDYGIIYLTEQLAELIPETISRYDEKTVPAITLIPNHKGSKGIGLARVNENVEKAVGQNIL